MNSPEVIIARALANAYLAAGGDVERFVQYGSQALGKKWRWLRPLGRRIAQAFVGWPRPRQIEIAKFVLADDGFCRAWNQNELCLATLMPPPPAMQPVEAARSWPIPSILTPAELADWLGIAIRELDWFADLHQLAQKCNKSRIRHYHYRPLAKRFGQLRLIESPKARLKQIQRQILAELLDRIPPHDAAHGFRRGCSIATFAAGHVGQRVVMRMDLQNFFPSISVARIQAIFRTAGYPERVADLLAGLCTTATPEDVWEHDDVRSLDRRAQSVRRLYSNAHLPQGAPTSPALANLAAYRLDCRLTGLAQSAGARYTRYADDLAFSGSRDFERVARRFQIHASATVMEEGFAVHHRKTRIMRQGVRQRLAGMVVNDRLNIARDRFDRLKATLTNCIRHGPQSQNHVGHADYRSHLQGQISFVEMINPEKAHRLRKLLDQIEW